MVTPDDIENRVFSLVRRGYDPTEVDDFLREVAAELSRAQGGLATPPPPPPPPPVDLADGGEADGDDFSRLGEEVAEILRQAHRSVTEMRHRAEADAALIRQQAQEEADQLRAEADRDRQAAGVELEAARARATETMAEIEAQSAEAASRAEAAARARVQEVIEQAKVEARGAVQTQRNVRGRLEGVRVDVDSALDRLATEDEDLFPRIDMTDTTLAEEGRPVVQPEPAPPPPGQGPPSPPVPPPARSAYDALDLPYDTGDDGETIDLSDQSRPEDDGPDDDEGRAQPVPPPPPPPADDEGATAAVPDAPPSPDEDEDGLAQMVKDAVENALRRRKGDAEPTNGA